MDSDWNFFFFTEDDKKNLIDGASPDSLPLPHEAPSPHLTLHRRDLTLQERNARERVQSSEEKCLNIGKTPSIFPKKGIIKIAMHYPFLGLCFGQWNPKRGRRKMNRGMKGVWIFRKINHENHNYSNVVQIMWIMMLIFQPAYHGSFILFSFPLKYHFFFNLKLVKPVGFKGTKVNKEVGYRKLSSVLVPRRYSAKFFFSD